MVVFVAGLVSYMGVNGLNTVVPSEYAYLVPIIVMVAGYVVVQSTENRRVAVAEELIREEYEAPVSDVSPDDGVLNDEYTTSEFSGED
jgi:hypothetical protein